MTKTIEEILVPKPEARPRIYACSIDDKAHMGLLKVGQTTRDVKRRVAERVPIVGTASSWTTASTPRLISGFKRFPAHSSTPSRNSVNVPERCPR